MRTIVLVALSAIAASCPSIAAAQAPVCDAAHFTALKLDQAVVTATIVVEPGAFTPAGPSAALPNLPSFCRVMGEAMPTA
jgi:hypothetical protein